MNIKKLRNFGWMGGNFKNIVRYLKKKRHSARGTISEADTKTINNMMARKSEPGKEIVMKEVYIEC